MGPGRAPAAVSIPNPRATVARARASYAAPRRISRVITSNSQPIVVPPTEEVESVKDVPQSEMDIEDDPVQEHQDETEDANEQEIENMVGVDQSDEDETSEPAQTSKHPRIWPDVGAERAARYAKQLQAIRENFQDEVDMLDTTMVSEYAEEIFEYMCDLEVRVWFRGMELESVLISGLIRKKSCPNPTTCPIKPKSLGRCARR